MKHTLSQNQSIAYSFKITFGAPYPKNCINEWAIAYIIIKLVFNISHLHNIARTPFSTKIYFKKLRYFLIFLTLLKNTEK